MRKMNKSICYINPGLNLKRPISHIANILKNKAYNISIFAPRKKDLIKRKLTRHYDSLENVKIITYPVLPNSSGYGWPIPINFDFLQKSWKLMKENDIIHVWVPFYPNTFFISLLKLLFFKKKMLILTMDTIPAYSFKLSSILDPLFKIFYKTVGRLAFMASNYCTIYAHSILEFAQKAGIPKRKLIITPTGINLDIKEPDKDIRKEFNIKENQKIVLFVGLHNKRKGIDLVIKIALKLKEKNKEIIFLMVGDGVERKKSMNLVSYLSLEENFRFTGTRRDIHNFYNEADLFLLPSRGEGLAGVLMEAMIYRVPIVTSNIAGTRDIINHMENGLLCEMEDVDEYARMIVKLLNDKQLREKFKEKALNKIKEKYLWDNNIKGFEIIYKSAQ